MVQQIFLIFLEITSFVSYRGGKADGYLYQEGANRWCMASRTQDGMQIQ